MTTIKTTKVNSTTYDFTVMHNGKTFTWSAAINPDNGQWKIPAFNAGQHPVLLQNTAKLAHGQLIQYLRKNPLYVDTKKVNGATGKRIFSINPLFG